MYTYFNSQSSFPNKAYIKHLFIKQPIYLYITHKYKCYMFIIATFIQTDHLLFIIGDLIQLHLQ